MSAPVDSSGLNGLLSQTMQVLGQLRGGGDGAESTEGADAEPLLGFGESADGLIRVTAAAGGRLTELELDPRAMRLSSVQLSEQILLAANAALADLRDRVMDAAAGPNLDALATQLVEVQEESTRQMSTFLQALTDAQERIASQGRR
jgi:hypothetical protein